MWMTSINYAQISIHLSAHLSPFNCLEYINETKTLASFIFTQLSPSHLTPTSLTLSI